MERRDFIKSSCTACIALSTVTIAGTLLNACKTPLGVFKTAAVNKIITIPLAEFQQSNFKIVRVKNYSYDLAVQKNPGGDYTALILMCTHAGQQLTKTGQTYYCTLHGSQFSHEGSVLKGPAEKPLTRLALKIEHNNLLITIPS